MKKRIRKNKTNQMSVNDGNDLDINDAGLEITDGGAIAGKAKGRVIRLITVLVIIAASLAVVIPFAWNLAFPKTVNADASILTVKEDTAQVRSIQNVTKVVGTVESDDARTIMGKASGEIIQLNVNEGDYINEGDIICVIDSDNLTATALSKESARVSVSSSQVQVENARLSLTNAERDAADAQRDLERNQTLYDSGAISLTSLESYQKALSNANSAVRSARNALSSAQYGLDQAQYQYETAEDNYSTLYDNLYIKANMSGTIESLDVKIHDNISQQTQICTISKKEHMQLVCNVADSVASNIAVGDTLKVIQKGQEYTGTIASVSKDADVATGMFEVKIDLQKATDMATNSKAAAYLNTESSDKDLTIPYSAVYYDGGEPYVFVDVNGAADIKYIETGIYNDEYIVVTSGLTTADKVITSWTSSLAEGALVKSDEA